MAVRQGFNLSKSERGLGACEECRQDADAAKKVEDRGGEQAGWSSLDSRLPLFLWRRLLMLSIKQTEG